jgi:hypothetical protein
MSGYYLDRHAGIYQVYSGLFSGAAWVCRLAHMPDSMVLATYWPFIIGIVAFVELRFFLGCVFPSGYRIWMGMTLALLVNALGADYFSPQSVGFVVAIGIYALAIGQSRLGLPESHRITLLVWLGCSLAVTHELTPYIVGGVLAVLAIFRVIRPWYTPAAMLLPTLLWMGLNWKVVHGYISFAGFLDLANFTPPKTVAQAGLSRLPIVGESSHALLLGLLILIIIAITGFARARRSRASWVFLISAGIGLALIAGNSYGNEGIFRAALFGIPWLVILSMRAIPEEFPPWLSVASGLVSAGLLGTFLVANFGLDNAGVIRQSDMHAMKIYQDRAAPDSDLLNLSYGDIPTDVLFPADGFEFNWQNVATPAQLGVRRPDAADAVALANEYVAYVETLGPASVGELYALWSPAAAAYAVDYGLETQAQADQWRQVLAASKSWRVVFHKDGTYLYVVNG